MAGQLGAAVFRADRAFPRATGTNRPQLASLTGQSWVTCGRAENLEAMREWVATAPNARLLVVPDSKHYPFIENPGVFFPAAERFLEGAAGGGDRLKVML